MWQKSRGVVNRRRRSDELNYKAMISQPFKTSERHTFILFMTSARNFLQRYWITLYKIRKCMTDQQDIKTLATRLFKPSLVRWDCQQECNGIRNTHCFFSNWQHTPVLDKILDPVIEADIWYLPFCPGNTGKIPEKLVSTSTTKRVVHTQGSCPLALVYTNDFAPSTDEQHQPIAPVLWIFSFLM